MDERKRSGESLGALSPSSRGESKRAKREESTGDISDQVKELKDEESATDKLLRERNTALREALLEKNRRIQFLEGKCGSLFAHRHATDMRLQAVLNHWTVLLKTLHTLLPNSSKSIEQDIKDNGFVDAPLPSDIQCEIDEWFLSGTDPTPATPAPDTALEAALTAECAFAKTWVHKILDKVGGKDSAAALQRAVDEKAHAERQALALQDTLRTYKRQVQELKADLNAKELERHTAARRLDRLTKSDAAAAMTPKASDSELQQKVDALEASTKEAQEKLEKALAETSKARSFEIGTKQAMDELTQVHHEKLDNVNEELSAVKDELQKLKYKAKDIETHMHEKWERKMTKMQTDNSKLKAKVDELTLKNAELRQRLAKFSAYRDQFNEFKAMNKSLETEVAAAKERLAHAVTKARQLEGGASMDDVAATHESEINALVSEIEAVSKETDTMRKQMTKTMTKLTDRDETIAKLNASLVKAEQTNALCFDELAGVRLQVASLVALQKSQKTLETGLQETIKHKEEELVAMRDHIKKIEKVKGEAEKEKTKYMREVAIVKQTYMLPRTKDEGGSAKPPCEQCEVYKKKDEEREEKLQTARAAGGGNEMSELDCYELMEARKKLNCSVCQDKPKEVMISKCSHMFCKECMDNNLKARNRKCPTCKKMFGQDDVKGVWWT
ncbi:Aste57867_20688 [Aphanomyces stellatus]|uniref:E3 ubiquitin protein ligase n=1 Tax=Aphanomyces stellatus TaxID=120398 RepID=A0A485LFP6_9STRA|nr:hypothetical protein As57867_020620 [Aphanomyces stellatus]VFT97368.1 Aste57867_20688 [Aphanomyces stellatus]